MSLDSTRRKLIFDSIVLGVAGAASLPLLAEPFPQQSDKGKEKEAEGNEPEVTATEDLMREHGVLRRALLVFLEVVPKLRQNAAGVDGAALQHTTKLFRTFGENYHERMLEEQHIFPLIRKQGPELKRYADILVEQHNRGREVTDYVLAVTNSPPHFSHACRAAGKSLRDVCPHVPKPCGARGHDRVSRMEEKFHK